MGDVSGMGGMYRVGGSVSEWRRSEMYRVGGSVSEWRRSEMYRVGGSVSVWRRSEMYSKGDLKLIHFSSPALARPQFVGFDTHLHPLHPKFHLPDIFLKLDLQRRHQTHAQYTNSTASASTQNSTIHYCCSLANSIKVN